VISAKRVSHWPTARRLPLLLDSRFVNQPSGEEVPEQHVDAMSHRDSISRALFEVLGIWLASSVIVGIGEAVEIWVRGQDTFLCNYRLRSGFLSDGSQRRQSIVVSPQVEHSSAREGADPLNIILISLDTVRADHLGLYGYSARPPL